VGVGEGLIVAVGEGVIVAVFVTLFGVGVFVGSMVAGITNVATDVLVGVWVG